MILSCVNMKLLYLLFGDWEGFNTAAHINQEHGERFRTFAHFVGKRVLLKCIKETIYYLAGYTTPRLVNQAFYRLQLKV